MRTEIVGGVTIVTLSRRNLLSLLAKVDGFPEDSECGIYGPNKYPATLVRVEKDEEHYNHDSRGKDKGVWGIMDSETELFVLENKDTRFDV